jgi:hypothetical protein
MKKQPTRSPSQPKPSPAPSQPRSSYSQPKPLPSRHQYEHEVKTQIHDPEENMMVLARWAHRALKNPTRFWGTIVVVVGGVLALVLLSNLVWTGMSSSAEIWSKVETAKSPADRVQIAEDYPKSSAASWARLQAATEYYNQGFADLPNNRDVALPTLKKALDNFDAVAKEAAPDSPQARAAAMGKARTLEARNELAKAIEQYKLVAKTWPDSAEAAQAKELAAALEKPEAAEFYADLYKYSPSKVTLPPLSSQKFDMPLLPSPGSSSTGLPAEMNPSGLPPTIPLLPPPPPSPVSKTPAATEKGSKPVSASEAPTLPGHPLDSAKPNSRTAPPPKTPSAGASSSGPQAPKGETKPGGAKTEKP